MKITTKAIYEWDKDTSQYVEVHTESYEYTGPVDKLLHGIGRAIEDTINAIGRGISGEGWYMGEYRGSDALAESTKKGNEMMRDELFGGGSMSDFNDMLAEYEESGTLPEGRAGEVLENLANIRESTMGEFDIKDLISGEKSSSAEIAHGKAETAFDIAGQTTDLLRSGYADLDLQEEGVGSWLESNMFGLKQAEGQTFQKTGGISGPTRGGARSKRMTREAGEQKYAGIDLGRKKLGKQIGISESRELLAGADVDIAKNTWDIADLQGDLLGAERATTSASMDQDRTNAMNQIKDLLYELETSELQFKP